MNQFLRDGIRLRIDDADGSGQPVIFQHGLCGDAKQTAEVFPADPRFRRFTLECRGHGGSEAGDPARFSIATFADDLIAIIDPRGLGPCVIGGISMGAAIALRIAVKRPDLILGLILARPAWVTEAAPVNMAPNAEVGALIAKGGSREAFENGPTAKHLAKAAPDNLASLLSFFDRKPLATTAALLQAISADGPGVTEAEVRAIRVPTLVIGIGRDFVHPLAHAETFAALIPNSKLAVITAKADDRARYVADFQLALKHFLKDFA